jgi:predicted RNA-binding Zn ribbon-like protein
VIKQCPNAGCGLLFSRRQDRAYIKTADFSDICSLAGFEAEYVRKHVISKIVED